MHCPCSVDPLVIFTFIFYNANTVESHKEMIVTFPFGTTTYTISHYRASPKNTLHLPDITSSKTL